MNWPGKKKWVPPPKKPKIQHGKVLIPEGSFKKLGTISMPPICDDDVAEGLVAASLKKFYKDLQKVSLYGGDRRLNTVDGYVEFRGKTLPMEVKYSKYPKKPGGVAFFTSVRQLREVRQGNGSYYILYGDGELYRVGGKFVVRAWNSIEGREKVEDIGRIERARLIKQNEVRK